MTERRARRTYTAPCYNFGQKAKETPRSEIACLPD